MADILEQIADNNRKIYLEKKLEVSLSKVMDQAFAASGTGFAFEKKLKEDGMSFICECKKASPSKGIIAEDFPYLDIARSYEKAGASCISCLTEPKWFMGSLDYLEDRLFAYASVVECDIETSGHYPPWEYNSKSQLQEIYIHCSSGSAYTLLYLANR